MKPDRATSTGTRAAVVATLGVLVAAALVSLVWRKASSQALSEAGGHPVLETQGQMKDDSMARMGKRSATEAAGGKEESSDILGVLASEKVRDEKQLGEITRRVESSQVGRVRTAPDGRQELVIEGKVVFVGHRLGRVTRSRDGTVALSSYDASERPIDRADSDRMTAAGAYIGSVSQIWIVEPEGQKKRVSPDRMHARCACISPDGSRLAFEGVLLDERNVGGPPTLYVADLATGRIWRGTSSKDGMGRATPLWWNRESSTVAVLVCDNETGSSPRIEHLVVVSD